MKDHLSASVFIIHTKYKANHFELAETKCSPLCREEDVDSLLTDIAHLQQLESFVWIINERALVTNSSALFDGNFSFESIP